MLLLLRTVFALGSKIIAQQGYTIKIYKSSSPPAAWLVAVFPTPVDLTECTPTHTHIVYVCARAFVQCGAYLVWCL